MAPMLHTRSIDIRTNGQAVHTPGRLHHTERLRSVLAPTAILFTGRQGIGGLCCITADHVEGYRLDLLVYPNGLWLAQ
jgi:hypothetical protein